MDTFSVILKETMMKLLAKLQASKQFWFLLITSTVFFLLRLPSLFEPYWYGDEGIYEVIGFALRHGRMLYSGIWDNKPPMLYLVYALFSGDQTTAKFMSLLAGLGATLAIFFLSKKLFARDLPVFLTTGLFAVLFGLPLIEGNIANAENFMLVLGILSGLLIYTVATDTTSHRDSWLVQRQTVFLFSAGLLAGISFLFKVVGMFDMAAFAVFLAILALEKISKKHIVHAVQQLIAFFIGCILPMGVCTLFFLSQHIAGTFFQSILFSNVSYVNYGNQLIIPQGFLILKTLLVIAIVAFLFFKRKLFSTPALFILLWTTFSLYSALFSQRPYTHYLLVLLPSFSLLIGLFVAEQKRRVAFGIITLLLFIFVIRYFSFYNKTLGYYQNFISYVVGSESTTAYRTFFDRVNPRDYQIASFISSQPMGNKSLFVWGNSGQIYKMVGALPPGRFIVAYHITMTEKNYQETQQVLQKNPPAYLITLPGQDNVPIPLAHYKELVIIDNATIYAYAF